MDRMKIEIQETGTSRLSLVMLSIKFEADCRETVWRRVCVWFPLRISAAANIKVSQFFIVVSSSSYSCSSRSFSLRRWIFVEAPHLLVVALRKSNEIRGKFVTQRVNLGPANWICLPSQQGELKLTFFMSLKCSNLTRWIPQWLTTYWEPIYGNISCNCNI